jgi:pimeloyl-ACP methyl ester carboxylesterase
MNFKYLLCILGIILSLPILVMAALAFTFPISISGVAYLLAYSVAITGLVVAPWMKRHALLTSIGIFVFFLIAILRINATWNSTSNIQILTLPQGKSTRWLSYVIDEQDSLIFGEALFHFIGGSSAAEHAGITQALYQDYSDMRQMQRVVPSPILNTYLGLQSPIAFDAVVIEPEVNSHPEIGVIFLHGYMGNVTAQCWEIAQAVSRFGAVTACPSTKWTGEWWKPQGQAILKETFQYLRKQGVQKFYLGGFSNGGFGISRIVSEVNNEEGLKGLFFIDGIADGASIKATGLPVLIIQGSQDTRMPAVSARQISQVIGETATYVEINSDHFVIMKKPEPVQDALAAWLEDQQSGH